MTGISRYVRDPQIRKILRETDGLGTEATRAGIIELLFRRNFIYRTSNKTDDKKKNAGRGKQIHATEAGIALIRSLPEQASLPDMTAQWETGLSAISQRQSSYQHFMTPLETRLGELIAQCKSAVPTCLQGIKSSPGKSGKKPRKPSRRPTKKPARQAAAKP
jgi:DNA topoisomerase-3